MNEELGKACRWPLWPSLLDKCTSQFGEIYMAIWTDTYCYLNRNTNEWGKACGWPPWAIWRARLLMEVHQSETAALFGILIRPWRPLRGRHQIDTFIDVLTDPDPTKQQQNGFKPNQCERARGLVWFRRLCCPTHCNALFITNTKIQILVILQPEIDTVALELTLHTKYKIKNTKYKIQNTNEGACAAPPIGYYRPQQHRWASWWGSSWQPQTYTQIHIQIHTRTQIHIYKHINVYKHTPMVGILVSPVLT